MNSIKQHTRVSNVTRHWLVMPMLLLIIGLLAMSMDLAIARYFRSDPLRGVFREILEISEFFGHAVGIVFMLMAIYVLDPKHRRNIPRIATGSLGAGLVADLIKLTIARIRPRRLDLALQNPLETFGDVFPLISVEDVLRSFPSAHTSVAVGMAVMLSAYYPRGRSYFIAMAALCGLHRMQANAHYFSDILVGAAVGTLVAGCCLAWPVLARPFGNLEAGISLRRKQISSRPKTLSATK